MFFISEQGAGSNEILEGKEGDEAFRMTPAGQTLTPSTISDGRLHRVAKRRFKLHLTHHQRFDKNSAHISWLAKYDVNYRSMRWQPKMIRTHY